MLTPSCGTLSTLKIRCFSFLRLLTLTFISLRHKDDLRTSTPSSEELSLLESERSVTPCPLFEVSSRWRALRRPRHVRSLGRPGALQQRLSGPRLARLTRRSRLFGMSCLILRDTRSGTLLLAAASVPIPQLPERLYNFMSRSESRGH